MNNTAINLVKIETRTRSNMWYRVDRGTAQIGLITKFRNYGSDINPWKAFLGLGHNQIILGFSDNKFKCAEAVEAAFLGKPYDKDGFEKHYGVADHIPAWKAAGVQ